MSPVVELRLIPWQFRIELAPNTRDVINTSPAFDNSLRTLFENAGWHMWFHNTGFCIAPITIYRALSDTATVFSTWNSSRDSPLSEDKEELATVWPPRVRRSTEGMPALDSGSE
jgi:hypothetical protein